MAERKSTNGQRSAKHTYNNKDRVTRTVNPGAPEGWAVPAPLVTPVVSI